MTDRKTADSEALKLLIDSGVVDRKATLEDFVRLSLQLEQVSAGDLNPSLSWSFFVKGKYMNRDDSPPLKA
jgi:hypothetical protein